MSVVGPSRQFDDAGATSGLPPDKTDIRSICRHVSKVPFPDITLQENIPLSQTMIGD
jgi:hypothetical protein